MTNERILMLRAMHDRCFVDFTKLNLPISTHEALDLLHKKGFEKIEVDMMTTARTLIGKASFRLGARISEAPEVFDCSSLTKWLFGQKGIWLPRFAVQQFEFATSVPSTAMQPYDLVFTSGFCKRAWHVGHVGLYTGSSVITAMIQPGKSGLTEMSLENLLSQREIRGVGRIIRSWTDTHTLIIPPEYEVETTDDIRHLVLSWIT